MKNIFLLKIRYIYILLIFVSFIYSEMQIDLKKLNSFKMNHFDDTFLNISITNWAKSYLKNNDYVSWSSSCNDCGEQTGNPEIDKNREIPTCVDLSCYTKTNVFCTLVFSFTSDKEKNITNIQFFYGYIYYSNIIFFNKLQDFKKQTEIYYSLKK